MHITDRRVAFAFVFLSSSAVALAVQASPETDLHGAAKKGNVADIRRALELGAKVNARAENGDTALVAAVDRGYIQAAELLLQAGADPNVEGDFSQASPLARAAMDGRADLVALLLRYQADPNRPLRAGGTTFRSAVEKAPAGIVRMLLDAGAKIDGVGEALERSVKKNERDILALLLARGADPNAEVTFRWSSELPLVVAAREGSLAGVEVLLAHRASPDRSRDDGVTALMSASGDQAAEIAARLLAAGARLDLEDKNGDTALVHALARDRMPLARFLVERGASPRNRGTSPLALAAERGELAMMRTLLGRGAPLDTRTFPSPLVGAARGGQIEAVRLLIASGVQIDHGRGGDALMRAVTHDDPGLVALLLDHGAAADGPSAVAHAKLDGALVVAARNGNARVVSLLIDRGASVDAEVRDYIGDGETALMAAAGSKSVATVRVLLDRGAALDRRDRLGRTSLIHAVHEGRTSTVALLLERGADANIADRDGRTALDHCFASNKDEKQAMWRLLDKKGARGKGYLFGQRRSEVLKWVGASALSLSYLGLAVYVQSSRYHNQTGDNPMRWVSYALVAGGGATAAGIGWWALRRAEGLGAIGAGVLAIGATAFTVAYGVSGFLLRDNKYGYYASAGLAASIPLLVIQF